MISAAKPRPKSPSPAPSWSSSGTCCPTPAARHADLGYGYYQARTDTDRKLRNHIRLIQALGVDVTIPPGPPNLHTALTRSDHRTGPGPLPRPFTVGNFSGQQLVTGLCTLAA
jgi:hypothetical protein